MRTWIRFVLKALVVSLVLPLIVALAIGYTASPAQAAPADPFTGASSSFDELSQ